MTFGLAIYGMGTTGMASLVYAIQCGYKVFIWDDNATTRAALHQECQNLGGEWCDFTYYGFPDQVTYLLLSPGIPWNKLPINDHPVARLVVVAYQKNIHVGCDIDFFLKYVLKSKAKCYAVSGTNGKTSIVNWLTAVTQACGKSAIALGNNGVPALAQRSNYNYYFFELSSYQLDLINQADFDRLLLLNISLDHIQRYGSIEMYVTSKQKISNLLARDRDNVFVCSQDDKFSRMIAYQSHAKKTIYYSSNRKLNQGIYLHKGKLIDNRHGKEYCVLNCHDFSWLNNMQHARNLVAVYALLVNDIFPDDPTDAALVFGKSIDRAFKTLSTANHFAHRQNPIAWLPTVLFIDDSKATNPIAAADALIRFKRIHWIVGGQSKSNNFDDLGENFNNLSAVYVIGESRIQIINYLSTKLNTIYNLDCCLYECNNMQLALHKIAQNLQYNPQAPETVLLSPACAAFDQFKNYQHRGQIFQKYLYRQWPKIKPFNCTALDHKLWRAVSHGVI